MQREYQGFIFTKHALERSQQRGLTQDMVVQTLQRPDRTQPAGKANTSKFIRDLSGRNVQVVATYLPDQKKWLVVSVWVRGEDDQVPVVWQLLTLPFKLLWWLIKWLLSQFKKSTQKPSQPE